VAERLEELRFKARNVRHREIRYREKCICIGARFEDAVAVEVFVSTVAVVPVVVVTEPELSLQPRLPP
jgi:hypothetical protein